MSLDKRTLIVTQISAAVACNALAALRLAVSEAANEGLTPTEIKEIIATARDIQQQPISHVAHLTDQFFREPKKTAHKHDANCGCGNHHA
ncbi:MAG: hypothetical protein P4L69_22955 [Desulfosporosinus sp.]|nr:hypothetical protein [Desulfosporosinus sp.]